LNATGGAVSSHLKDEDPLKGAAVGAISSGIGYIGGKIFQGPLEKLYNPISKQYEWIPIGIWTITKPAPQSPIPTWIGGAANSSITESVANKIGDYLKGENYENKNK
jgi:hypothetical protein